MGWFAEQQWESRGAAAEESGGEPRQRAVERAVEAVAGVRVGPAAVCGGGVAGMCAGGGCVRGGGGAGPVGQPGRAEGADPAAEAGAGVS